MGAYHYIALNADGKREKGVSEAESARQVREQLREKGLMPLEVTAVGSDKKLAKGERAKPQRKRLSSADLALLTRQMSTLLAASMPVDEVLTALAEQTEKPHVKGIILGGARARVRRAQFSGGNGCLSACISGVVSHDHCCRRKIRAGGSCAR